MFKFRPVPDDGAADDDAPVKSNGIDGEGGDDDEDTLERRLEVAENWFFSPLPSLIHILYL